ncbi:MAG: GNAT family N-acetyltransferase [Thermoplasmata archaeon]|nr:GNAT family N-acetyltransferase [Thermoplasmata archaeon]
MEIRNFRTTDLDAYVELRNEAEAEDPNFEKVTKEDVTEYELEYERYDPEGHFSAVEGGKMIGSGRGIFSAKNLDIMGPVGYFRLYILKDYLETDVEKQILTRIEDYLRAKGAEWISTRADTRFEARVQLLERLGLSKSEYENHGMEQDTRDVEDPRIPDGFRIRVASIPDEIELMLSIFNEAFATREAYPPMSLRSFRKSRIFAVEEDQSGVFLAIRESDNEVVGMVISQIDRKHNEARGVKRGGTYALAVIPSERRKGLGTALTIKSLKWIREKGMEKAYIGVNWDNLDAVRLYEATGYQTIKVHQGYRKSII